MATFSALQWHSPALLSPLSASGTPQPIQLFVIVVFLSLAVLLSTYVFTTIRYKLSLNARSSVRVSKATPLVPPRIPYAIPFLGSAFAFLAPHPGAFWRRLFKYHPRSTGACTLLLGGQSTHVLFSPHAVSALFKARGTDRQVFNNQIMLNSFGMSWKDCVKFYGLDKSPDQLSRSEKGHPVALQEKVNHDTLLKTEAANELTAQFTKVYGEQLSEESGTLETGLYAWLRPRLFKASTIAFMGKRVLDIYPNLEPEFFAFDSRMMALFFGLPKFLVPKAFNIRDRALDGLEKYNRITDEESNGVPTDPNGEVRWEPTYGSRGNRARQMLYRDLDLSMRGRASLDLGFLFGLSSNAIPTIGWLVMHTLCSDDKTLLPRVMEELKTVARPDGSLDIPKLISLPLLLSMFHEVLRLYTDVLVTRQVRQGLVLPINDSGEQILVQKGSIVMAPSWLGHRDDRAWSDPPSDTFYAERFLKKDPESGKEAFTMSGTNGKLFPFGGGRSICPGRVFAKQEVLSAFAMTLLTFNFEVLGFLDKNEREAARFPDIRAGLSGSGIMVPGGDIKVKITRR